MSFSRWSSPEKEIHGCFWYRRAFKQIGLWVACQPKLRVRGRRPIQRAFTLIELLVVIAIISLLVSVLLPSLNRAKDLAKGMKCAVNLKHIGLAVLLYSNDYDERFPCVWPSTYGDVTFYPGVRYFDSWLAYLMLYTGDATEDDARKCAFIPGTAGGTVWDCPSLDTQGLGNFGMRYTNYAYDLETTSDYLTWYNYPPQPQNWRYPSRILLVADARDFGGGGNTTSFEGTDDGRGFVGANHLDKFNGVFVDGHVESPALIMDLWGGPRVPVDMCVYGYVNGSYAAMRLGYVLPPLW